VRPIALPALASLSLAACGLDFDKYDPIVPSAGASSGDASDAAADAGRDSASASAPDAEADAPASIGSSLDAEAGAPASVDSSPDASQAQDATAGCTSDLQCPSGTPYCSLASAQCVQCITNTNCGGTFRMTLTCTNGKCL